MLSVQHLKKGLGKFSLKDITFELPPGYIMGLIGPNGSGKTTLLKCILSLYRIDEGEIHVNGISCKEEERRIKENIGYVFQEDLFLGDLSLAQNGAHYGKYYSNYSHEQLLGYIERFGLDASKKLKRFSKGEKLKFQFAFALAHQPKLLCLDEPTGSFDPEFRKEFFRIVTDFVKDGNRSVILATHITEDLEQIADYITLLYQGRLLLSMDRGKLEDSYRLITGEEYKINLIEKGRIIQKEKGMFGTKALIHHSPFNQYDRELEVAVPSLEDLMYFLCKK